MTNLEWRWNKISKRSRISTLKRVCIKLLNGGNNSKVKFWRNLKEISKTYRPLNYCCETVPIFHNLATFFTVMCVLLSIFLWGRMQGCWKKIRGGNKRKMVTRFITYFNLHSFICLTIFYFCKVKKLTFYSSSRLSYVYHVQVKTLVL